MANALEKKVSDRVREMGGTFQPAGDEITSPKDFLIVKCGAVDESHTWLPRVSEVLNGHWCPKCEAKMDVLNRIKGAAKHRPASAKSPKAAEAALRKAISSITGLNATVKNLYITCERGHEFRQSLAIALVDSECPMCFEEKGGKNSSRSRSYSRSEYNLQFDA